MGTGVEGRLPEVPLPVVPLPVGSRPVVQLPVAHSFSGMDSSWRRFPADHVDRRHPGKTGFIHRDIAVELKLCT